MINPISSNTPSPPSPPEDSNAIKAQILEANATFNSAMADFKSGNREGAAQKFSEASSQLQAALRSMTPAQSNKIIPELNVTVSVVLRDTIKHLDSLAADATVAFPDPGPAAKAPFMESATPKYVFQWNSPGIKNLEVNITNWISNPTYMD